ncbi:MAG TPA: HdeD family acid-resistance protein [Streptosporangiaceae bacterium]|nr:HdeD family acid-resistance protein [Streptosporangiaceae bacterium]
MTSSRPPRQDQLAEGELSRVGPGLASAAWPAFIAAGIASIAVGVILLAWPKQTLTVVAVLIGIALIVAGVLGLMDGFTSHEASGGKRLVSVVIGLLATVLGLYCIRHYHFTITALAIIVGLFWVIHGVADIAVSLFIGRFPGRGFTMLTGGLSLCAGIIVLFWPAISITVLVVVIGIWLILYGALAAVLGLRLRTSGE